MRPIKFRGKDDDGNWLYGDLRQRIGYWPSIVESYCTDEGKVGYREIAVKEDTVGQFTGWNPRKCGDLYEGDIIGFDDWAFSERERKKMKHHVGVIEWSGEYGKYLIKCKDGFYEGNDIADPQLLGNKYDNPELLQR